MTVIDRRYSVAEGTAVKAPCRAATTANITLSGEQTIDGVAVVEGDRVLVKNQTTGSQNGIYSASTGNWTRARDFDGAYDIVTGTRIFVTAGSANGGAEFVVSTTGVIVIDTTSIAFTSIIATATADAAAAAASASAASSSQTAAAASASAASASQTAAAASAVSAADSANILYQRGRLSGLILSTAGSSATFGVSAGTAINDAATGLMLLASAYTKTTSAWAVGTGNGALDTGAVANSTWYHVYLIKRVDTGVVDVLFSLSASAPTMPTNYTLSRRIGSMKTDGSAQWTAFTQFGDDFIWFSRPTDVNNIATVASAVSKTLTVPTGITVKAFFRAGMIVTTATAIVFISLVENGLVPSTGQLCDLSNIASTTCGGDFERWTDTSAQISVRATGTGATYTIQTMGWRDLRGK